MKRTINKHAVRRRDMVRHVPTTFAVITLFWLLITPLAHAHGTEITAQPDGRTITINALFDTGEPMAEAQVLIYAPDDPQATWQKGVTDDAGLYSFEIDPALAGDWSINIRTAGHGQWLYLTVAADGTVDVNNPDDRPAWVKWSMAAVVVAGLIGIGAWSRRPQEQ